MKMHIELYMLTFTDLKSAEASKLTLVSVVMYLDLSMWTMVNISFNAYIDFFLFTGVFTALISKELQLKTCKVNRFF